MTHSFNWWPPSGAAVTGHSPAVCFWMQLPSPAGASGRPLGQTRASDSWSCLPRIALVTGATGYVGGRLVPELLEAGFTVRCLARRPAKLRDRPWFGDVEVATGDAADPDVVRQAAAGVDVAYYLVHSLGTGSRFATPRQPDRDRVRRRCSDASVGRLVYLGGLAPESDRLSPHLASRREVGEILLRSGVPTVVLRAAVILGSGSASFEMLRYLTERLPVMVAPRWIDARIQPIAIRDVLRYLVGAASIPAQVSRGFDIGGPEILTYRGMMLRYAEIAGLPRRRIFSVPVLTPSLSSHWVGLVTPVPASLARPLVDSLRHEVVCKEHDIAEYVPDPPEGLVDFNGAVELALKRVREYDVATAWHSADLPGAPSDPLPTDPDWAGGSLYVDERETRRRRLAAGAVAGHRGHRRSDRLVLLAARVGGARRTRPRLGRSGTAPRAAAPARSSRSATPSTGGEWRRSRTSGCLRLRAEMRLPGLAWLEFIISTNDAGRTVLRQRAVFHPHGLAGHLYWAAIAPFHGIVFGGMQRNIARAAEAVERTRPPDPVPDVEGQRRDDETKHPRKS